MKKFLVLILMLGGISSSIMGQGKVDTIYYDSNWKGCEKPFATYYRIYSTPTDPNIAKKCRDYFITGELQSEGEYISIDKYDDSRSVFDGPIVTYFKSGKVQRKCFCKNGKTEGEYVEFKENGLILRHANFSNGQMNGIYTEFDENNFCIQAEFANGQPINNVLVISNANGLCSKIDRTTNKPIYESPTPQDLKREYRDGEAWPYYFKNGILVAMTNRIVNDYGKYYQIPIVISNSSLFPIDFDPAMITATIIDKKGREESLQVLDASEYMRKVQRRQNWAMALTAFGEGLNAANAGYSTSTTNSQYSGYSHSSGQAQAYGSNGYAYGDYNSHSSYSGVSSSTTTTYDASAAYQAQMIASQRVASYSNALMQEREIKNEGYLKKTTVYPGQSISGYVNIERKKGKQLEICINLFGANYLYYWDIQK